MSSCVLTETPEKTSASTAVSKSLSPEKAADELQSKKDGEQSKELEISDDSDDDGLPCVHEGHCKGGCSCGGFSQRNDFTLKGILRGLAIEEIKSLKKRRVS